VYVRPSPRMWERNQASACRIEDDRIQTPQSQKFCGPVFDDIKSLMSSFGSCSIRHVYRGQNVAAHCLARSSEDSSMSVWRGVPPECIQDTICIDSMFG
jgi:hypothetical protein